MLISAVCRLAVWYLMSYTNMIHCQASKAALSHTIGCNVHTNCTTLPYFVMKKIKGVGWLSAGGAEIVILTPLLW